MLDRASVKQRRGEEEIAGGLDAVSERCKLSYVNA